MTAFDLYSLDSDFGFCDTREDSTIELPTVSLKNVLDVVFQQRLLVPERNLR